MARFDGIPLFTGTIGPICIYRMHGRYFMRTRSNLTSERVKRDPAFRKTMEYSNLLARASRIASAVYVSLPAAKKQHPFYRRLTGEAMTWLKFKWSSDEIIAYLKRQHGQVGAGLPFEHTRLNPTYRRQTPRLCNGQRIGKMNDEKLNYCKPYSYEEFCRQEYVLRRRKVNKTIISHVWADGT